jgi:hypothetical protein
MMRIEERVRDALHADAARLQVPEPPPIAVLEVRRRLSPWRLGLVAAAAVALVVALVTFTALPGVRVEFFDGDPDDALPLDEEPGGLDFDGEEVFASGRLTDEVRWVAAARMGELLCVGAALEGPGLRERTSSCEPATTTVLRVSPVARADEGHLAISGWVSDEVARVVWELPAGPVELELHERADLPVRVFAAGGEHPDEITFVSAYDADGQRLGTTGIASREAFEREAAWQTYEDEQAGLAVEVPPGWHVADQSQTPNLAEPVEILTLATVPLTGRSASRCAHQPGAVEQLGADDALVTVQERNTFTHTFPARPSKIRHLPYGTRDLESTDCFSNADDIVHERIDFQDAGRAFYVYTTYGGEPPDELREVVLRIVNSLTFSSQ